MNANSVFSWLVQLVFAGTVLSVVIGAVLAVSSRRIIRSVAGLALSCIGLAGLYYFLRAPFLALMEILIYVGAICVTIVFAVMLAEPDEAPPRESRLSAIGWCCTGTAGSLAVFHIFVKLALAHPWPAPARNARPGAVEQIGAAFLSTHAAAFELMSVVLVVAIIGALVLARFGRGRS